MSHGPDELNPNIPDTVLPTTEPSEAGAGDPPVRRSLPPHGLDRPAGRIGPYRMMRHLGSGAFGDVWLAMREGAIADTPLAVKLPRSQLIDLESVRREARIWVQAGDHPNVLPIFEADVYDDQIVIVSEYVEEGSLSEWLDRRDGIAPSVEFAVEVTLGILAGLEHLHSRGIVHRDIKPSNVLLQRGIPRLVDFGLARALTTTESSTVPAGTSSYM